MGQVFNFFPGQTATFFLQTLDGYGNRADSDYAPTITRVILPNLSEASGYPVSMARFDIGLYYGQYQIPTGGAAVGTYLVDIFFYNPADGYGPKYETVQIVVQAPFGNFAVLAVG